MAGVKRTLKDLLPDPPEDLMHYFKWFKIKEYTDFPICLLDLEEVVEESLSYRGFHPLAQALNLVFLDDPETSDHHCYVANGPLAGGIVYFRHDGDTKLVFADLEAFTAKVVECDQNDTMLVDWHSEHEFDPHLLANDQARLATAITGLLDGPQDGKVTTVLITYIASLGFEDRELLQRIAVHPDMYIPEALAFSIARAPRKELLDIAATISQHPAAQTSEAGKAAIRLIEGASA